MLYTRQLYTRGEVRWRDEPEGEHATIHHLSVIIHAQIHQMYRFTSIITQGAEEITMEIHTRYSSDQRRVKALIV